MPRWWRSAASISWPRVRGVGVEVEGEPELVQRLLVQAAGEQPAAGAGVLLGRAQARPLEAPCGSATLSGSFLSALEYSSTAWS